MLKLNDPQVDRVMVDAAMHATRQYGLVWFTNHIFRWSVPDFVGGKYVDELMTRLATYDSLLEVGARDHFKSYHYYAEIMAELFGGVQDLEGKYYSYTQDLAREHLSNVRKLIDANPYFSSIIDLKPNSDSHVEFKHPNGTYYEMLPKSLQSFKRGLHVNRMYVDDALKDEAKKMRPKEILKINDVIKKELPPMLRKQAKFRAGGTTQTNQDFYFNKKFTKNKKVFITPAVKGRWNRTRPPKADQLIWPEFHTPKEIFAQYQTMGRGIFDQEYMCVPFYKINTRIKRDALELVVDSSLRPRHKYSGNNVVVAGWDIGKIRHPSFFSVFMVDPARLYTQLFCKWMHHMDYSDQIDLVRTKIKDLNIDSVYYDATRGEFDVLAEKELLPPQLIPVRFTRKSKEGMATLLDQQVTNRTIKFLDDPDQTDQILAVDSDLEAIEYTNDKGQVFHGDSFWGNALALKDIPSVLTVDSMVV